MSKTFLIEYANGESSATTGKSFPSESDGTLNTAKWIQCDGAGTVVAVCEGGTIFTRHAKGGEVYKGSFTSITSTTCQYLVVGNGPPPPATPANGTAAQATIADAGNFTAKTNVEDALQEIYQDLESAQKVLPIPLMAAIVAAGTPMAAFANNTASNPGITLDNSKAVAIRWNNNATQAPIWMNIIKPLDMDVTKAATIVVLASKSGATVGDATTFDVGIYEQTPGALEDAGSNLGGTTSALVGNATAKTVSRLTLTVAANTLAAPPGALSISIQPTNGTLGTDDAVLNGFYLVYQRKLLTS